MDDTNDQIVDQLLASEEDAKSFIKWFLRVSISEVSNEFATEEDYKKFLDRRDRRLSVQVDDLLGIKFSSAIPCKQEDQTWFKIVKDIHLKSPLSSDGSQIKSSRFNYKNVDQLRNRTVYFGENKDVCFGELFHLDIQKAEYSRIADIPEEFRNDQFEFPKCHVIEYKISLENILVLTSEASYKAISIPDRVVKDEWFSINDEFAIPSSGQILGTLARKQGYNGILYASVRSQTKRNLVLFEENVGPLSRHPLIKEVNRVPLDPSKF